MVYASNKDNLDPRRTAVWIEVLLKVNEQRDSRFKFVGSCKHLCQEFLYNSSLLPLLWNSLPVDFPQPSTGKWSKQSLNTLKDRSSLQYADDQEVAF